MNMIIAGRLMAFMAISLALTILTLPGSGQDLILFAEDNCSLGNSTLHIVDVDAETAKVWLVISEPSGSMLSEILSLNDTLLWKNRTLDIAGIYAGDISDMVLLRINSSD